MRTNSIQEKIHEIRGQRIMLDYDLAEMYEVETKRLKESIRRNKDRFPSDFMFELTRAEYVSLRTQIASLKNGRGKHRKYMPYAFTEQGVSMLSAVLNSQKAVDVSIAIIRTFVMLRQYALNYSELKFQIKKLEKMMNRKFKNINEALKYLLNKDQLEIEQKERKRIGYK